MKRKKDIRIRTRILPRLLITGGAGFIGTNNADYFLTKGYPITLFDNLSRKGSEINLSWLKKKWGSRISFVRGDVVTDKKLLDKVMAKTDAVIHLAAQVAVTTSVENPYHDFHTNAHGTLNVLEAVRRSSHKPAVLYASTNKVHGTMEHAKVALGVSGYHYPEYPAGVAEHHPLDFHSPYGCSKGAADQYVRDYARIYGIPTVVFRQSCIYGPHQMGMEDQGWVAWFVISVILGRPLTIYGDGHQVRDVLHVDDLSRLYEIAVKNGKKNSGKIYNIGGGAQNSYSLLRTIQLLERIIKKRIPYSFSNWRPGDQKVYVSDISRVKKELGWAPAIGFAKGLPTLVAWVRGEERNLRRLFGISKEKIHTRAV